MFGFGRKRPAPALRKSNPGIGAEGKIAFTKGSRSWTEEFNLVSLAASALKQRSYAVTNEKTWLDHRESGFMLVPQLVEFQPLDDGGVRTVTTIQSNHPRLSPEGVFEYQHSAGPSVAEAVTRGFDQWIQTDFITLLEALRPKPETCTALEMSLPPRAGMPARVRRAVLGPVAQYQAKPAAGAAKGAGEDHSFCPCCLLTKSYEAFREFIEGDRFYGVRLFAARDPEAGPQADCRVNGDDWEKGKQALREYVRTWPGEGYEFRKQYVVLQDFKPGA